MSLLQIVVGGQFGSEGKGHVAAQLAARLDQPLVIRTGGPNAGHTVLDSEGNTHKLRQLPTAAVSNPDATLAISAGSLVDLEVLAGEVTRLNADDRLLIDPQATVIEPIHRFQEAADPNLIGWSTQKGIGAARSARVMRTARTVEQFYGDQTTGGPFETADIALVAARRLRMRYPVLIEAAQGYGLGLHTRYYPKTTSANCTAIDALADVGLSPWGPEFMSLLPVVWIVFRPYPIRVAGDSGPLVGETSWAELNLPEERTTVTNKVRRVGTWDHMLATEAVWANGGPAINIVAALTMVDQVIPEIRGMDQPDDLRNLSSQSRLVLFNLIQKVEQAGAKVRALGTGPATMIFLEQWAEFRDYNPGGISAPIDSAVHRSGE